jgi:hypothetical protein
MTITQEDKGRENQSGFGRDLCKWKDKNYVLPGNTTSIPLVGKNMEHPAVFPIGLPELFIQLFTIRNDFYIGSLCWFRLNWTCGIKFRPKCRYYKNETTSKY